MRTLVVVLAVILAGGTGTRGQAADAIPFPPDFPSSDLRVWTLQRTGLIAKRAAAALARAPDSAEAFELLLSAERPLDALGVLEQIANNRPDQLSLAVRRMPELASQLGRLTFREPADRLRELLPTVTARVGQLPREDEAQAARHLLTVATELGRRGSIQWAELIDRYVRDYAGTEAALIAQVDAITARPINSKRLEQLETFARMHPDSCAAAKAHFRRGSDLAHNGSALRIEPSRGDPLKRLLMVDQVVKELESGRYAHCEPAQKAGELIVGFFMSRPTYAAGSVERILAVYEGFVRSHFVLDDRGATAWGIGYLVSSRMAELYALQGDRVGSVERLLEDIARDPGKASAARYLLAEFYRHRRDSGADHVQLKSKARQALAALHAQDQGLYGRKALATLAVLEFGERQYEEAARHLRTYLTRYPDSPWAWVAGLRLGHALMARGEWTAAASAFQSVAARFPDLPPARVLAHAYTARAWEAAGRLDDALAEHERALAMWDDDYGPVYSLYFTRGSRPEEPFRVARDDVEVAKTALATRVAELQRSLAAPGAALLERGRVLFGRADHDGAIAVLTEAVTEHPSSPMARDARLLLHRARLTRAIERGDAAELESLSREPFDFWVAAAGIGRAAMLWKEGATEPARTMMKTALDAWFAHQQRETRDPPGALERDVLEIRQLVFRPRGGGLFAGTQWELRSLEPSPTPFFVARTAIDVKLGGDAGVARVRIDRPIPEFPNVLFWNTEQLAFFDLLLARIGGTEKGTPATVMAVPNQPVGGSRVVLELMKSFFPARPGHWGGWMIETFPMITHIEFSDAARTKAAVRFTVGYEGATAMLEKKNGVWTFKELTNRWIT